MHCSISQGQNKLSFQLTLEEGKFLVNLARQTVTEYLKNGKILQVPESVSTKLMKPCGVFVTLNSLHNGAKTLRGCIGLPYPTTPLVQAVIEAALSAATRDPRFPPVAIEELDQIIFEVSVLTPPERVKVEKPTDYPSKIKVGQDGLIVEKSYCKGLLLPQVPVEFNWEAEEFLCQCSMKGGLSPDSWLLKDTKIYRFQAIIFEEASPKGQIKLKKI
ncbi:MAG: TIGR00296 family protein [Candidatus Bathyarchaeota archaeon]|nr:TIGR00296 family protein [Candidatus Bathyarchaeota archaeon]